MTTDRKNEDEPENQPSEPSRPRDAERERALRLELLAQVGRRTTAILSLEDLLRSSAQIVAETFSYFMVSIFFVDGNDLVLRACTLPGFFDAVKILRIGIGKEGITGWVAANGKPLNVPDVRQEARYHYEIDEELQTRSELAVPILLQGAVIGVLDAQSTRTGPSATWTSSRCRRWRTSSPWPSRTPGCMASCARSSPPGRGRNGCSWRFMEPGWPWQTRNPPRRSWRAWGDSSAVSASRARSTGPDDAPGMATLAYTSFGKELLGHVEQVLGRSPVGLSFAIQEVEAFQSIAAGGPALFIPAGSVHASLFPVPHNETQTEIARILAFPNTIVAPLAAEDRLLGFLAAHSPELTPQDIPVLRLFADQVATAWRKAQLVLDLQNSVEELRRAQEQLLQSQKMEAVGRLAGGVAHDFNNHLTAILGYTDLLTETLRPEDTQRADLGEIRKAALLAADLTRQLLAFSRKQMLQPRVVDFNLLVSDMKGMLQRLLTEDIRWRRSCLETRSRRARIPPRSTRSS